MGKLSLRRTQLIVPFGVGSIVNMPDQSLMACGIDFWDENTGEKIYDERLQRRLGINHFKMPASSKANDKGVPFVRFPQWMFCVSCRSLRPISTWKRLWESKYGKRDDYQPRCETHKIALIAARFIVACENGHIDDFPWLEWVHGNKGICNKPDLTYKTGGSSAGLEGISIECKNCGNRKSMVGSFDREIFSKIGLKCKGHKPWQKSHESCDLSPLTLQRGASNVYFPKIVSSIFIPPFSDDVCSKIRKTPEWAILSSQTGGIDNSYKENLVRGIIARAITDEIEIRRLLEQMLGSPNGEIITQSETEYRYDEFKALTGQVRQGTRDSKQFSIEIVAGAKYKIDAIDKVVLVHRLRELRALVAFSRIKPLDRDELGTDDEDDRAEVRAVPVRERANIDWFPAVEVRGEGIFITFNMGKIQEWAQNDFIKERVSLIQKNHAEMARKFNRKNRIITPAFVLLHTFAHVLIRQFSYECGYSSASLRERIYCSEDENVNQMAAVLIYTASGDSEGTLGGLVNQGKSEKLSSIIADAISQSLWCSSDPVCIDSRGQGMGSLNLAACHACVLLSETSCEENNKLLDRAMLVGTPERREVGFFSELL